MGAARLAGKALLSPPPWLGLLTAPSLFGGASDLWLLSGSSEPSSENSPRSIAWSQGVDCFV